METKEVLKEQTKEKEGECKSLLFEDVIVAIIEQLRRDQKFSAVRTYGSTLRSALRFRIGEDKSILSALTSYLPLHILHRQS